MAKKTLLLGEPAISRRGETSYYHLQTEGLGPRRLLWFSVPARHEEFLCDAADAAVAALLIPAMAARLEAIEVDGPVSERLLYHLQEPIQSVARHYRPKLPRVEIKAAEVRPSPYSGGAVVAGHSGGADATSTILENTGDGVPEHHRITHLLHNNVGSHGIPGRRWFRRRSGRLQKSASRLGLPLIPLNSNLAGFYPEEINSHVTETFRNASAALVLQGAARSYMLASCIPYERTVIRAGNLMSDAEAVIAPMFSTESLEVVPCVMTLSRVQRIERLLESPVTYHSLDVCLLSPADVTNCSRCNKCRRTMLTLEILGALDKYASQFDLDVYRRERLATIAWTLASPSPFDWEVCDLMRRKGFRPPPIARPYGWWLRSWRKARDFKRRFLPVDD